jgi:predicted RNase H-like nuclease
VFAVGLPDLLRQAAVFGKVLAVGIDMPIGLPDAGRREADVLARAAVGPRWQSVFMTPVRAALAEPTFASAVARSRELAGEGISKQAFALRPRLLEVDAWVATSVVPVFEVHPEVSFTVLAGHPPEQPKKTWAGAVQRRGLLAAAGVEVPDDLGEAGRVAAVDDILDAAVAAWSARRWAAGAATSFPDPPERFGDGYICAIWA